MKYYGKGSLASYLKMVLDVLLVIGAGLFIFISKNTLSSDSFREVPGTLALVYGLFLIGSSALIFIVYNLRKMISTMVNKDPFIRKNVQSLKNIRMGSFIIALCYFINYFINFNYKNFRLIYLDANGIHTDFEFFIFFFAGLFILILEKIFKMAVKYKEDNDLTI